MSYGALLFDLIQRAQGRNTSELYKVRLRSQWQDRHVIRERQFRRLKELLVHSVEQVPYYRDLFADKGVDVRAIRSFRDFSDVVPLMQKEELRSNLPRLHADDRDSRLIIHRTGGSSGQPLEFPRDRLSVATTWADYFLTRSWWGVRPGDPSAKIWGHFSASSSVTRRLLDRGKDEIKSRALNQVFMSAYSMTEKNMDRFATLISKTRPVSLYGYASSLDRLASYLEANGRDVGLPGNSVLISTSEPLADKTRNLCRRVFQCAMTNEYGACEVGVIAFECPAGRLHVLDESIYLEVIGEDGRPVEEGIGEVVVTVLSNFSVPQIRYRLGDIGRLSKEPCSCGRGTTVLESIDGRTWSLFRGLNGASVYPDIIMKLVMRFAPTIDRFQAFQDRLDHVEVKLESRRPIDEPARAGLGRELAALLGEGTVVDVHHVREIEPEKSGKFIPVKSKVS